MKCQICFKYDVIISSLHEGRFKCLGGNHYYYHTNENDYIIMLLVDNNYYWYNGYYGDLEIERDYFLEDYNKFPFSEVKNKIPEMIETILKYQKLKVFK